MKILIGIAVLLIVNTVKGQSNTIILAEYMFTNKASSEVNTVQLTVKKDKAISKFYSFATNMADSVEDLDDTQMFVTIKNKDTTGKQFYVTKDEIVFRDFIYVNKNFQSVIVSEKTPVLNWELTNEESKVNGVSCYKALLKFRGRNYIAWYAPDIATPFGPWKFYGLPGLIVRITSDDNIISFSLTTLSYPTNSVEISKPTNGRPLEFKDYVKQTLRTANEIFDNLESKLPRGITVTVNKFENNGIEKNFD